MTSLHNFARKSLVFFFAITGAGLFAPSPTSAQPAPKVTLLVKTARGLTEAQAQAALRGHGGAIKKSIPKVDLHVIEVPAQAADAITKAMKADSKNIARVETEWTRKAQGIPSDTLYPTQWALPKIGWDQVYGTVRPGTWTRVAILDTGVEGSHPDFAGVLAPGTSIIDASDGLTDSNGHGTWLAGIVAARTNNGLGIAGVGADFVQVMPVKVLDANGEGQDSDVIAGLIWAVDNGAKVVLMAFSNPGFSESLQEAIDYAWSKDVVLIAAAGNTGDATPTFPAGDRGVMGVSATDEQDQLAGSSTFGPSAFIAAPGTNIAGTALSSAYTQRSGTSAAAAMVAGAAAYLRAVDPALTNGVIVNRLASTAEPAGTQQQTGNGRLQIARALADTSTVSVQPAGADPVGTGGPFVGPYKAAAVNVEVYEGTCSTATASFNLNATVCARATGLGNETHHFEWFNSSNTLKKTSGNSTTGSFNDTYVPDSIGAWTVKVIKNAGSVVVATDTFSVTGKSSQTITFGALSSKNYGDADINVTATASSGLTVTFSATGQCTVNGTTVHITAAGSCTITADQAGNTSYNAAPSVQQTFNIARASVTATAGGYSGTYDGNTHAPGACVVTGAYTIGVTCTNDLASVGPNVGSGSVVAVPGGASLANFDVTLVNGNWSISKAPVTATAGSYSGTYDGATHALGACVVTGAYTIGVTCTNDLASVGPNVGSGSVVAVPGGASLANFNVTLVNGNWSISKAPVTATAGSYSGTYDGATHAPGACVVTGAYTIGVTCTNDSASVGPNVGSGSVVAVPGGASLANFNVTLVNGNWSISKAPVTATAGSYSGTYDGATHAPDACVVTGSYTTGVACTNDLASVGPNVGSGSVVPVPAGASLANFDVTLVNGNWSISKAPVTATAGSYSGTYDGNTHAPGACVVTGSYTTGVACTNDLASVGPNVGSGSVVPVPGGASLANFDVSLVNGAWSISKAPVTATAGGYSGTYDGNTHAPGACVVTGSYTTGVTCTNDLTSVGPNVGSGSVVPVPAGASLANFDVTLVNGNWSISKAPVTATAGSGSGTYSGSQQAPAACLVTGAFKGAVTCSNSPVSVGPNAGAYAITPSVNLNGELAANFTVTLANGSYTIKQAVTVTTVICPTTQQPYSGSAQTPCTATVNGPVLSLQLDVVYINNTNPGVATASALFAGTTNYFPSSNSAPFTIYNVTPVVIISAPVSGTVVPVGTTVTFKGTSTDTVGDVPKSAIWTFDTLTQAVTPLTQDAAGLTDLTTTFRFTTAGVYKVKVTVIDGIGGTTGTGVATQVGGVDLLVVVYDPSAGFVTGGGWIDSASGASLQFPDAVGKANFGFVSKYHKGATVPTGETEFQFKAGNLNFNSTRYDWLVLNGGTGMAQYKGSGTVNGVAGYTFMLTARDGDLLPTRPKDGIRMKIADSSGNVVYDNMRSKINDDNTGANTQDLGGGSIQIHQSK